MKNLPSNGKMAIGCMLALQNKYRKHINRHQSKELLEAFNVPLSLLF